MEVPIPNDWEGTEFCRWAVCWPSSPKWKAILYGLLEMPTQGRFWDFHTGNFLLLRNQFRQAYDYNFNLQEVIMACGDTGIAEGLQAIAASLQAMATASAKANSNASAYANASGGDCCANTIINQGGGVQGRVDIGGGQSVPLYGTEPPLSIPPGEWPEGYESREEYDLDKCQVANLIVDGLISSLRALGAISGAETGAALAFLIIASITASILFPPAAVGIVAAAFGIGTVIFTVLLQAVTYIQEHREEWVCALYQSDTTDEIITLIAALIAAMVAALLIPSAVAAALTTIVLTLLSTDTLNQLFRLQAHLTYPDADCTCADQCPDIQVYYTEEGPRGVIEGGPQFFTAQGTQIGEPPYPDRYFELRVRQTTGTWEACEGPKAIRITNVVGFTPGGAFNNVTIYTRDGMEGGSLYYEGNEIPDCITNCSSYSIRSATPFTMDIEVSDEPCV